MKKITALVLNDEEETTYRTGDSSDKFDKDILVKSIYLAELTYPDDEPFIPPHPIFVVEFNNGSDDAKFPYHSVLLIRREK